MKHACDKILLINKKHKLLIYITAQKNILDSYTELTKVKPYMSHTNHRKHINR